MSILARFDGTCSLCRLGIRSGVERVEKYKNRWVHAECRTKTLAARAERFTVIQMPEARGSADAPEVTGSNDRIQHRRHRGGRLG